MYKFNPYKMNAKYIEGIEYLDTAYDGGFLECLGVLYDRKNDTYFLHSGDGHNLNIEVENTDDKNSYFIYKEGYYVYNVEVNNNKPSERENNAKKDEIVNYIDDNLLMKGNKEYIYNNLGNAIDVIHNGGSMLELDHIVCLQELLGFNISYELYSFIASKIDESLLEICNDIKNKETLLEYCKEYVQNGIINNK